MFRKAKPDLAKRKQLPAINLEPVEQKGKFLPYHMIAYVLICQKSDVGPF